MAGTGGRGLEAARAGGRGLLNLCARAHKPREHCLTRHSVLTIHEPEALSCKYRKVAVSQHG